MDKSAVEKVLEGSLLNKLGDPRYFIMFSAFGLYWDSCLQLTSQSGLLHLTYRIGDPFPLGSVFFLIGSFSLLAAFLSPVIFWISNYVFWELWYSIPENIRSSQNEENSLRGFRSSVLMHELKLWAIKNNNSLAMSLVKDKEVIEEEVQKNRPPLFLLVLCVIGNYFFTPNGVLREVESAFPTEFQEYFFLVILVCLLLLLYSAFTKVPRSVGYVSLLGLKEHIAKGEADQI